MEPGAHFYRSYQLDARGQPHQQAQRLAGAQRALRAADSARRGRRGALPRHSAPRRARGPIRFTARLNYRKFSWYYTQFAYAGQPKPGQDPALLGLDHNGLEYRFSRTSIPANVSGEIRGRIPDLPIVTLAAGHRHHAAGPDATWTPVVRKQDRERWNDWGIGLLLQGDLKGAEYAFQKVTEAEPGYADGWLNVARALIQEGETDAAKPYIEKALAINPHLGRTGSSRPPSRRPTAITTARLQSLEIDALAISARPRGAEPDRPHAVSEARVRRRPSSAQAGAARSIPKTCRCTTP